MDEIKKIQIVDTKYNLNDTTARNNIDTINNNISKISGNSVNVNSLTLTASDTQNVIKWSNLNNTTQKQITLSGATSDKAGLMTPNDKNLLSSLYYNFSIGNTKLDITDYFLDNHYLNADTNFSLNNPLPLSKFDSFKCIFFKVKVGDKFSLQNFTGGVNHGKTYGIFDLNGKSIEYSTLSTITKDIEITTDGYIFFNEDKINNKGRVYIIKISNLFDFHGGGEIMSLTANNVLNEQIKLLDEKKINNSLEITQAIFDAEKIEYDASSIFKRGYYHCDHYNKLGTYYNDVDGWEYCFLDVKPYETYYIHVYSGNHARGYAFIDKNNFIIKFCNVLNANINQNITIPDNCVKLLIHNNINDNPQRVVIKNEVKSRISTLEDFDSTLLEKTTTIIPYNENGCAYNGNVGEAPKRVTTELYKTATITNWQANDILHFNVRCGSSYPIYLKLKNNVIVEKNFKGLTSIYEGVIEYDGTFDTIIFNYYDSGNEADGRITLTGTRLATDVIKHKMTEIEERVSVVENQIKKQSIKILCFGNSFTQDSMSYVPFILQNIAPQIDLTLGIAYLGGCTLAQHYANFADKEVIIEIDKKSITPKTYGYYKSINGGKWSVKSNQSAISLINDEDWDIITFQQGSDHAEESYTDYYEPYIHKIQKLIFDNVYHNVKLGWLLVHSKCKTNYLDGVNDIEQETHANLVKRFNKIANNTQIIEDTTAIDIVFPYGTAIQNLRTIDEIEKLRGASYTSNDGYSFLLADGVHLQDGLGCLCGAYCNVLKILECVGLKHIGIIGENTTIDVNFINNTNVKNLGTNPPSITSNSNLLGINEQRYIYLAQIAATKAIQKPYEITDLNKCNIR